MDNINLNSHADNMYGNEPRTDSVFVILCVWMNFL